MGCSDQPLIITVSSTTHRERMTLSVMALKINGDTAVQFSDYVAVLARRKLVLLAGVVLGVAAALGYSFGIATPAYVSQAEVLVRPVVDRPFNPGTAGIDKALNMGTEMTMATSNSLA